MESVLVLVKESLIRSGYDVDLRMQEDVSGRRLELLMVISKVGNKYLANFRTVFNSIRLARMTPSAVDWLKQRFPGTKVGPDDVVRTFSCLAVLAADRLGEWQVTSIKC